MNGDPKPATSSPPSDDQVTMWNDLSRRKRVDAKEAGEELLRHLGVPAGDIVRLMQTAEFQRLLIRWAIEFPLNIKWYDAAILRQQRYYNWSRNLAIVIGAATIVGTTALILLKESVTVSQLAVLVAGIFGVLQIMTAGTDPKARLGGFRKARAELKESMFTFLDTWTDRTTDSQDAQGARPTPDFLTGLMQEIRNGRKVARAERDTYFGTYKSVAEILGSANAVLDTLKKRQTDLVGALKDAGAVETSRERAVSTRIQDLHNKLAEATAQKQALEDKLVRLTNSHVPQPQLAELQGKLEDAETERFRVQTLLDLTVKSDFAHSV